MRRLYEWLSLASLCGLCGASVFAADPPSNATRHVPSEAVSKSPDVKHSKSGKPSFAERMQAVSVQQARQQEQKVAEENRPKPTQWQMQNPSNPTNNLPTNMTGTIAANNYFGSQFHSWSNLSQPAPLTQLPFNQTATTPINQTNLYTAPNVYFGSQFSGWNNLRSGSVEPNAFGGWNYR